MDTVLLSAILAGVAVFFGLWRSSQDHRPTAAVAEQIRAWRSRRVADAAEVSPRHGELSPRA
jgi:hypothetical protein